MASADFASEETGKLLFQVPLSFFSTPAEVVRVVVAHILVNTW